MICSGVTVKKRDICTFPIDTDMNKWVIHNTYTNVWFNSVQFLFFVQRMMIISISFCQMLAYFCDWNNALFKWEKFVRASLVCLPLQAGRITPPPAWSGKRAAGIWHYSSIDTQRSATDTEAFFSQISSIFIDFEQARIFCQGSDPVKKYIRM